MLRLQEDVRKVINYDTDMLALRESEYFKYTLNFADFKVWKIESIDSLDSFKQLY